MVYLSVKQNLDTNCFSAHCTLNNCIGAADGVNIFHDGIKGVVHGGKLHNRDSLVIKQIKEKKSFHRFFPSSYLDQNQNGEKVSN